MRTGAPLAAEGRPVARGLRGGRTTVLRDRVRRPLCIALSVSAGFLTGAGLVAQSAAAGTGTAITASEGAQFSGDVGSFTVATACGSTPVAPPGPSGTITWGDGQTSPAAYTAVPGSAPTSYTVSGSHIYGEESSYAASVTTTYLCDPTTHTDTFTFAAQVSDAGLSAAPVFVSAAAGQQFSGPVASFSDADLAGTAGDYTAHVAWGDGTTTAASVTPGSSGRFNVDASHTYTSTGTYSTTVTITDAGGATTTASGSAGVSAASAPPSPTPQPSPAPHASFTGPAGPTRVGGMTSFDASGSRTAGATVSNFSWRVNGRLVASCDGSTSVLQTRFLHPGADTVNLAVTDPSGAITTNQQTVVVSGFGTRAARAASVGFASVVRSGHLHVIPTQQIYTCLRGPNDPVKTIVAPGLRSAGDGCQTQVQSGIISAAGCLTENYDHVQISNATITSKKTGQSYTYSSLPDQPLTGVPNAEMVMLIGDIEDHYAKNILLQLCKPGGAADLRAAYCQQPPGNGSQAPPSFNASTATANPAGHSRSASSAALSLHGATVPISQLATNAVLDTTCSQVAGSGASTGASGSANFDFSTACLDLYVSSGPVAVNGVEYVPHNGAVIVVAPQFNLVVSSDAEIDIGQLQARAPGAVNEELPDSTQSPYQDTPFLSFPKLAALVRAQPQAQAQFASVGGFQTDKASELQTSMSAQFVTTFTFEVDLPPAFSDGKGGPITAAIHGTISNTGGLQILYGYLGSLNGGGAGVNLGPVSLKNFAICYRHQATSTDIPNGGPNDPCPAVTGINEQATFGPNFWDATGELDFGEDIKIVFSPKSDATISGCTQAINYGFGFGGDPAQLKFAGASLTGLDIPVYPGVTFDGLAAGFKQGATPATEIVAGCVLFKVVDFVDVVGNVFGAFGPYQFTGDELGPKILQPFGSPPVYPHSNDFAIGASGVVSIDLPDNIGNFQVGGGYALYVNSPPSVFFGAGFDFSIPVGYTYESPPATGITLAGGIAGAVGLQRFPPPFYLEGYIKSTVNVGIGGVVEENLFSGSLVAVISDQPKDGTGGIALCGSGKAFNNTIDVVGGIGYHWGDSIGDLVSNDFHTGGDCSTSDPTSWLAPFFVNVQAASAQAHSAQAPVTTVHVPRGAKAVDVYLGSQAGSPDVTVTGPGGVSVTSAGAPNGNATVHDSLLLARVGANHQTYLTLLHPIAGTYKITLNPGSPPISQVRQAIAVTPSVKAHVAGRGIHRRLVYDIKREPGQMVDFVEHSAEGIHTLGGRAGGRGSIAFTAVPGHGRRQILAEVSENHAPGASIPVASYSAPPLTRLPAVRHLHVTRSGAKATISFGAVRGARSYSIYMAFDTGERRLYSTTARRRQIGGISAEVTALVTVQAMGDKVYTLAGAPTSAKLGAAYRFHKVTPGRRKHR